MGSEDMNQDTGKIGHILIVNSDPMMRQTVSGYFSEHNFPTSCASDWSELKCTGTPPCLIILNQPLGLNDGLDGLRSIRSKSDIPVIMTGNRPDELDRTISLELGADDLHRKAQPQRIARTCPRHLAATGDGARRAHARSGRRPVTSRCDPGLPLLRPRRPGVGTDCSRELHV